MKTLHFITVRGREHEWAFEVLVDPVHVEEWRADGLEIFAIENYILNRAVDAGLTKVWCFIQDLFNFRNPFRTT